MAIEPVILEKGALFTLTNDDHIGNLRHVAVNFSRLPEVVKLSDGLFLNDGNIQLEVVRVVGKNVESRVVIGGELRSGKGLNLPGIDLRVSAFTDHGYDCLKFALENGVDAIGQSFVETAYLLLFMNNNQPPTTIAPIPAHIGMVTVSFSLMANSIDPISARCV